MKTLNQKMQLISSERRKKIEAGAAALVLEEMTCRNSGKSASAVAE